MFLERGLSKRGRRGQITVFIIIAIIIVAGLVVYFLLKGGVGPTQIPAKFQPVEELFLDCIEDYGIVGASILGMGGGYIEMPDFEPGSQYRPFSSQLDFLGTSIPYWYYAAGNNVIKEQVPTKNDMEEQLEDYILDKISECDFYDFEIQGFEIDLDKRSVDVRIRNNEINVKVTADLSMNFGDEAVRVTSHTVNVQSKLGKFYDTALKIYNYEKKQMFLEDYAVDVLRLYAPVDGVELTCAPKIWLFEEVVDELKQGLEANMQAIRMKGDYYELSRQENKYFVQNLNVGEAVNFLYDRDWPTRVEVWDSENGILMAEPVGNQQGLGILGFCYVPYHFVYDVNYPVLIQIYDAAELFQFPVAVIIEKNKQREALPGTAVDYDEPELCKHKNQDLTVYTYNVNLDPVEAKIGFECLGQRCDIGQSELSEDGRDAILDGLFPQCGNGFVTAIADGYSQKRYQFSTNEAGVANIVLDRLYNLTVDLKVDSRDTSDYAIITFDSPDHSQIIAWPNQKIIQLSEGWYNISIYVYRDSKIFIPAMKKEQCVEAPKSGIAGIFGMTEEKCFDVDLPSQELENVISGGGKGSEFFIESQLETGKIKINVNSIPVPKSLEELQDGYNLIEAKSVYVNF